MKKIFLGGKYGSVVGRFALVDEDDFELLNKSRWYAQKIRNKYYACRKRFDIQTGREIFMYMHREILKISGSKKIGDHKDGDGLNNQKLNLRVATESENRANKIKKVKCSSKYLGVYIENKQRKSNKPLIYCAQVAKNGERYTTRHNSEIEAAKSYNIMALKMHGEFANLNIIIE